MKFPVKKIFWILYALVILTLCSATILESVKGSTFVAKYIYGNWCFVILLMALASLGVFALVKNKVWKNLPVFLIHLSLLVILLGGFVSFLTGISGRMHLILEDDCNTFIINGTEQKDELPFSIKLDSFNVRYYPGTQAPMDYVSYVKVDGVKEQISMNKYYRNSGYQFCQASYDDNGIGSWLSVCYDPWGVGITFFGYVMFVISAIFLLFAPDGNFRKLLRNPLLKKGGLLLVLVIFSLSSSYAHPYYKDVQSSFADSLQKGGVRKMPVIPKADALKMRRTQIVYQNRICPFNTFAIDFVKKVTGTDHYNGLLPEQVVGGWLIAPELWKSEKMILIKNKQLLSLLKSDSKYVSLDDLFEGNCYRLQTLLNENKDNKKLEQSIREVDEKVGLILMLSNNTLYQPLPNDGSVLKLSDSKVSAEILYNNLPFTKIGFMVGLTLGVLSFIFVLRGIVTKQLGNPIYKTTGNVLWGLLLLLFIAHAFVFALRWYVCGHIPISNGFETMQFLALIVLLVSACMYFRLWLALPFGFLLSGFALLVSYLGQMNPQVTQLVPVLQSPWLSLHVSIIMISYALLAFILMNAIVALVLIKRSSDTYSSQIELLTLFNKILLYPAVLLLGIGILLGAVWANESWGTYWSWDPKEVWALITFMFYGAALYENKDSHFSKPVFLNAYVAIAFLTVLMTYFGVNYVLGGMHSYAG